MVEGNLTFALKTGAGFANRLRFIDMCCPLCMLCCGPSKSTYCTVKIGNEFSWTSQPVKSEGLGQNIVFADDGSTAAL